MRIKAVNHQALLEFICYLLFSGIIFYLVISRKYLAYVTPRMAPYLYFTSLVMFLWACIQFSRLFRPQHKVRAAHCFILVLPLMLLLMPHNPIKASDLSARYIGGNSFDGISSDKNMLNVPDTSFSDVPDNSYDNFSSDLSETEQYSGIPSEVPPSGTNPDDTVFQLSGLDTENKKITVQDDEFSEWCIELFDHMEDYVGFQIEMKGFVYKDFEIMDENEFIPARMLMSCCVADLVPCGLICQYEHVEELEEDTWVIVEGVIHIGQYMGEDEPQITVNNIYPAEKPKV